MSSLKSQRGYLLVAVALLLASIAALGLALNREAVTASKRVVGETESQALQYIAEAGLHHASWEANQRNCSAYNLPPTPFASGTYQATFSPDKGSPVRITATAALKNGATRSIKSDLTPVYQITQKLVSRAGIDGKDAYIFEKDLTRNFGDDNRIITSPKALEEKRGLLKFNLASVPPEARVISAELVLYQLNDRPAQKLSVFALDKNWIEGDGNTGVNWVQHDGVLGWGQPGSDYITPAQATFVSSGKGWQHVDVLPLVRDWVMGKVPNHGLLLVQDPSTPEVQEFASSDHIDDSRRPELVVQFACECGAPGTPGSLVSQPDGDAGKDTYILSSNTGWGYSTQALRVTADRRSLLEFDLSSIPPGSTIDKATLDLNVEQLNTMGDMAIHRLESPWVEGNCSGDCTDGATWLQRNAIDPWATPGGDIDFPAGVVHNVTNTGPTSIDITPLLTEWMTDGLPNYGMAMVSSGVSAVFTHAESNEAANRPSLSVDFRCPCGVACKDVGSLNAGYRLLMVVTNVASPTPHEQAQKSLFESWGFNVRLLSEQADQPSFDAELKQNDVVHVGKDVRQNYIGTKLSAAAIGVVSELAQLNNELGISQSTTSESDTAIEVVDNTHHITAVLPLGPVTLANNPELFKYLSSPADGLQKLATTVSGYTLATLDAGAINLDGDPSPGRRVMLPWGAPTFDVANLTTAGLTILRRALEWASVATEGGGGGGGGAPCTGNLDINLERTSVDVSAAGLPKAVAYMPGGVIIAGSPLPAAGGWVLLNSTADRIDFITVDGTMLDSVFLTVGEKLNGISFIENGPHQGHLALTGTDEESQQSSVVIVDVAGNLIAHWKLGLPKQTGIAYIDDGSYAGSFILTSTTGATFVDGNANVVGTLPYALPLDNVRSIDYLPGGNLVAVANKTDSDVHILELSGALPDVIATTINQWDTAAFGVVDPKDGFAFDPVACEYALVEKPGVRMRLLIEGTGGSGASGTYRDEFNSKAFSGNDGSLSWNNTWQEINESDGPTKADVRVKPDLGLNFSLRIRNNDGGGEGVWREADLSGCSSASLSFNYRRQDLDNSNDYVAVSVSGSGGGTWTELVQIAGPGTDSAYLSASFDISAAMSGDTQLRLLGSPTLGATEEVYFDNIEINCLP